MQNIVFTILLISQVASPAADNQDIGQLPEIVVTAPRYENEDAAWAGLMPETVVNAPRYVDPSTASPHQHAAYASSDLPEDLHPSTVAEFTIPDKNSKFELPAIPGLLYSQTPVEFKIKKTGLTMSGDYHIEKGDTVNDEVTVTGGNAKIEGVIRDDLAVMGGMVSVSGEVDGEVAVFGGNLDITGRVRGDAAVFGGNIRNMGTIEGDLAVIGGTVMLDSGSVVEGDINLVGGTIERHDQAVVLGDIESIEIEPLRTVLPRISRVFRFPHAFPARYRILPKLFFVSALIVIFLINLLVLAIFPHTIDQIEEKLQINVWPSVGLGVGIEILYIPLILLFLISVIGIPLIPVFALAVFLATIFGFTALSALVGDRVCKAFKWNVSSRVALFSIGWLAIMIIPFFVFLVGAPIEFLGIVIIYVAATISIGAVIWALIKKENKESKAAKK